MENENTVKLNKAKLIEMIADKTLLSKSLIENVYDALESSVTESIFSVTEEEDLKINLFNGLIITAKYQPEKYKMNNFTGREEFVTNRIIPTATFTRVFRKKLCEELY